MAFNNKKKNINNNRDNTYFSDRQDSHYDNSDERSGRKIRRKKNSRQIYTSLLIMGIAVVIVVTLVMGYQGLLKKEKAYQENIEELNKELNELEETNNQMKNEMNNMDSKEFKEKVAREKLGMIGEDEVLIKRSVDGSTGRGTDEHEETTESSQEDGYDGDYNEDYDYNGDENDYDYDNDDGSYDYDNSYDDSYDESYDNDYNEDYYE